MLDITLAYHQTYTDVGFQVPTAGTDLLTTSCVQRRTNTKVTGHIRCHLTTLLRSTATSYGVLTERQEDSAILNVLPAFTKI